MSKVDIASSATKVAQKLWEYGSKKSGDISFTRAVVDTGSKFLSSTKTILGESFVKSGKTIINATPNTEKSKLSKAWLAVLGGGLVNGGLITYNGVNSMEDSRRINNMSANLSDHYTPYEDAYKVLGASAGAASLGLAPAAFGGLELAGEGLEAISKSKGSAGLAGKAMKGTGKLGNKVFGGFFKHVGGSIGKVLDGGFNVAGKAVGKSGTSNFFTKVFGKHYAVIAALTLGRAAYKTLKIDMIKNPNKGIASWNIGGKSLFIDNDPASPTFRQSIFLQDAIAKRNKENLERSIFSDMADGITASAKGAYRTV